jgi:hypothetical protein
MCFVATCKIIHTKPADLLMVYYVDENVTILASKRTALTAITTTGKQYFIGLSSLFYLTFVKKWAHMTKVVNLS